MRKLIYTYECINKSRLRKNTSKEDNIVPNPENASRIYYLKQRLIDTENEKLPIHYTGK